MEPDKQLFLMYIESSKKKPMFSAEKKFFIDCSHDWTMIDWIGEKNKHTYIHPKIKDSHTVLNVYEHKKIDWRRKINDWNIRWLNISSAVSINSLSGTFRWRHTERIKVNFEELKFVKYESFPTFEEKFNFHSI